jgi:hypothetical protein
MLRTGNVVRLVVAGLVLVAAVLAAPPLWLALDESAIPPSSTFPSLPDGAQLVSVDMGCGSGGCWQELTVAAPEGMSGTALAAEMVPDGRECAVRGPLDLRRVCTGAIDVEAERVRFFVQYDRS